MSTPARVTWRDDSLPHQIRLVFRGFRGVQKIAVTCNCGETLGIHSRWDDSAEPMALWREHMAGMPT